MNTAFLGVDVSKGYADFVLLGQDFRLLSDPVQFDDTVKGYKTCQKWLLKCIRSFDLLQIRGAVESTGGLENNWLASFEKMLPDFDLKVVRLNPATVKFASQATLSTVTTDAQSARNIAEYLIRYGHEIDFYVPENPYLAFKKVITQLNHFTKISTAAKNLLRQLIYETFPEIQAMCPKTLPNWLFELLKKYPTAKRIARAKPASLAKIPGITLEKAEKIICAAKNSAGSAQETCNEMLIRAQVLQIQYQKEEIKKLKRYIEKNVKGLEIDLLISITGVGAYSAGVMMILIGDIKRFATSNHLASFFGVTPIIRQSGDKKGQSCMSKKGASMARATLYMCARSAVIHDPHLQSIYARHREKGKTHNEALGVIMHKLLRIMWGVLTSQTPYNCAIDQKNQQNAKSRPAQSQHVHPWNSTRREQDFDVLAPVSNKTRKQRKEHLLSQVIHDDQVRDLEGAPNREKT